LPAEPIRSAATGWYSVTVLFVALLLAFTDRFIINLVADPIRGDLMLRDVQISLLQGVGLRSSSPLRAYRSGGWPSGSTDVT
jgi:hypothetical protein